ncbi:MAG: multiple antibiotic resistance (MarC)-related protein [uncultured bacterium]|nr:MAG: multiple antibiotic resistance (MarC)-related protein [uncultured bacterium]
MSILSATILLVFIMNPLGNLPFFISTLKPINPKRHTPIIVRETFFAYLMLVFFMFFGQFFLRSIQITEQALGISGGIILFIIAIRMIFPEENRNSVKPSTHEPFFVPLAIPMTAGPGALTTVMLLSTTQPEKKFTWIVAITIASIIVGAILIGGRYLSKFLGERGLIALERLSGMMLTAMAVQMFLSGVNAYFRLY